MTHLRHRVRLVVAALVAAAATPAALLSGLLVMAAPASAAVCQPGSGVSVVVDFRELGGGTQTLCDPGGAGKTAAALLADNGFALTYVQRQPGFVCRINGEPASDPCVNTPPTSAYWGLYWSNGTSGSWTYSSLGPTALKVPEGGSVGFAWQGSGQGAPGIAPPAASAPAPTPTATPAPSSPAPTSGTTPTKSPTKSPTKQPSPTQQPGGTPTSSGSQPGSPSGSASGGADPSSPSDPTEAASSPGGGRGSKSPDAKPTESESTEAASPTGSPTDAASQVASDDTSPASEQPSSADDPVGGGSVPLPLVLAIIAALGAAGAGIVVLRGRRAS